MSLPKETNKMQGFPINTQNNLSHIPSNLFTIEKEFQSSLENVRIIQKNMVYIVSIPPRFLDNEVRISFM